MRPILFAVWVIFATSGIVGVRVSSLSAAEEGKEMKRINPPEDTPQRSVSAPKIDIQEAVSKLAPGRVEFDLSDWAGQTVRVELLNQATGWSFEAGYWAEIAIDSN